MNYISFLPLSISAPLPGQSITRKTMESQTETLIGEKGELQAGIVGTHWLDHQRKTQFNAHLKTVSDPIFYCCDETP